ncbi:MAG: RidA family protein, partial [Acidobacteriota bacterium]
KDVVRAGVYLKDIGDFAAMNEIYARHFLGNPPARSTIGVELAAGLKVEIDCVAKLPDKRASRKTPKGRKKAKAKMGKKRSRK